MSVLDSKELMVLGQKCLMTNYGRYPLVLVQGKGARVWDQEGKQYLDFVGGLAVNSLGHCHPKVVAGITAQAGQLLHCSNLYWIKPQIELAGLLAEHTGLERVFFGNSGTEVNEAAIKLARKYGRSRGQDRYEIITMEHCFHGRTLGALAATSQEKFHRGFEPMLEGFKYIPFNDLQALEAAITSQTCAVMLEAVQGEGGVNIAGSGYLQAVRALCDRHDLLLIFDEIQCGLGRTGKLFGYQHSGVVPDMVTLAKALGGGFPIGALIAKEQVAAVFRPGDHGSTFGGNPLACAAGVAAFTALIEEDLTANAAMVGAYFQKRLAAITAGYNWVRDIRGLGLLLGLELTVPGKPIVDACLERGLIINCTRDTVLRFLPPLNITTQDVDKAVDILNEIFAAFKPEA